LIREGFVMSNQNEKGEKGKEKGLVKAIIELIQEQGAVIQILLALAAFGSACFGGGVAFRNLISICLANQEYESLSKNAKNATMLDQANQDLKTKNQELEQEIIRLTGCSGEITSPSETQVDGNITVSGTVSSCKTRQTWLIVTPNDRNCYVQGEIIPNSDESFSQPTSSIVENQTYKIYLVGIEDPDINSRLSAVQTQAIPEISCGEINLNGNKLDLVTVTNSP
jgi:hypothetical protein